MGYRELQFPEGALFLVTGCAGFIGSNLCETILEMGYRVRGLDDLSTGSRKNMETFMEHPNYEFIEGDIKDLETCLNACEGVDYVLNQAAWGSVPRSIEMPIFYCANNIMGTLNMMEAARQKQVKKFEKYIIIMKPKSPILLNIKLISTMRIKESEIAVRKVKLCWSSPFSIPSQILSRYIRGTIGDNIFNK